MMPTVAILAGGLGTRLGPITQTTPKALVQVNGTPFIDYQLRLLAYHGVKRVVLCVGHLGQHIANYVGTERYGLSVCCSFDGPELLGTGGALKKALPLLGEAFGVLYGDTYPLYDLGKIVQSFDVGGVMAVRAPGQGNVEFSGGRVMTYERGGKFAYGDAGFSVLSADELRFSPDRFDLGSLYSYMASEGLLDGYFVVDPVYEIGSPDGLRTFEEHLSVRR